MLDRAVLAEHVRDAFGHIHDPLRLRGHPLALLLAGRGKPLAGDGLAHSGEVVHRALLDAIEQLKPAAQTPPNAVSWRRYRYLHRRYIDGASHQSIADELGVSTRQAHRDHLEALEAVTMVFWDLCQPTQAPVTAPVAGAWSTASPKSDKKESMDDQAGLLVEAAKAKSEVAGPTDLRDVIEGVLELTSRLAASRGGSIEADLGGALPPAAVDRIGIRQVLLSLLSYVVEAKPTGRISLQLTDLGDIVDLQILSREAPHQRRTRPQRAETGDQATALLAAGRHLAELHGIEIRTDESAAGALTVALAVPVARVLMVLVIDDNPDVSRLFGRFLRGTGYRVSQARTWQQALALIEENPPDLVTLDLMMPSLDGWDVLRQLKALPTGRDVPVIVCSVLPERSLSIALGVAAFLPKPITRQSLLAALRAASRTRAGLAPEKRLASEPDDSPAPEPDNRSADKFTDG